MCRTRNAWSDFSWIGEVVSEAPQANGLLIVFRTPEQRGPADAFEAQCVEVGNENRIVLRCGMSAAMNDVCTPRTVMGVVGATGVSGKDVTAGVS